MEGKAWFSVRSKVSCISSLLSKTVKKTKIKCHIIKSLPCIQKPRKKNRCALIIDIPLSFPSGSVVKNPSAMRETQEMQVQFLGWEDPLEEEIATSSSILVWEIPLTEEPGGYSPGTAASRTWLSNWAHVQWDYTCSYHLIQLSHFPEDISSSSPTSQKPLQSYL